MIRVVTALLKLLPWYDGAVAEARHARTSRAHGEAIRIRVERIEPVRREMAKRSTSLREAAARAGRRL